MPVSPVLGWQKGKQTEDDADSEASGSKSGLPVATVEKNPVIGIELRLRGQHQK